MVSSRVEASWIHDAKPLFFLEGPRVSQAPEAQLATRPGAFRLVSPNLFMLLEQVRQ